MLLKLLLLIVFQLLFPIVLSKSEISKNDKAKSLDVTQKPELKYTIITKAPNYSNCSQFSTKTELWFTYDSVTCFMYSKYYSELSWFDANDMCRSKNATLATILDSSTNGKLANLSSVAPYDDDDNYWIGMNSLVKRGIYKWVDGSGVSYTTYANTTVNGDPLPVDLYYLGRCVSLRTERYSTYYPPKNLAKWFKDDCNNERPYICSRNWDPDVHVTTPTPPKGNCPPDWYQYEDQKCIKYISGSMSYNASKTKCASLNAELLSIHSQEEQDLITAMFMGLKTPYIGFLESDSYGDWKWGDQSKISFTNWGVQPYVYHTYGTKYCATIVTNMTQPGKWIKYNCSLPNAAICQKEKSTNYDNPSTLDAPNCKISGFENFKQYQNSCYSVMDKDSTLFKSFSDAEKSCEDMGKGAHLVSIVDPVEQTFLRYYVKRYGKVDDYWIGYKADEQSSSTAQTFYWTDDWPNYYTNWDEFEPVFTDVSQEICASMSRANGTWRTTSCDLKLPYICKITTNTFSDINNDRSGVCPSLYGDYDKSYVWVNLDKRSTKCYWFSLDRSDYGGTGIQTWNDASFHCRRRNGTLASIHSTHDLNLLRFKLSDPKVIKTGYYNTWIGLSKDAMGDYGWEDKSSLDFTFWDPSEKIVVNRTNPDYDKNIRCVEAKAVDMEWKQADCSGSKRNYFVCSVNKIYFPSDNANAGHGGRTAGIVIGVLLAIVALVAIGLYVRRRTNLSVPQTHSFENPLSKRGTGIKPQPLGSVKNNNLSQASLINPQADSPFREEFK